VSFSVDLAVFRGPLDLLLYLVRKHELDVLDIPIAMVTEQYLAHLEVLQQLDVNAVGEFLDMASWLMEIKSRMLLPRGDEVEDELEDPRQELVERLLEYRRYRDAASMIEERGRAWQERFPRAANDLVDHGQDPADQPIHEVELWDLVSAFGRILRDSVIAEPASIIYDDTPIYVYMERILEKLGAAGQLAYTQLFEGVGGKSTRIGIFLAILELVRHDHVRAEQNELFGEIWILPGPKTDRTLDYGQVDNYDHGAEATATE
jgi:segregation and condensation protein A